MARRTKGLPLGNKKATRNQRRRAEKFREERDACLKSMDSVAFYKWARRWNIKYEPHVPGAEGTVGVMHKFRLVSPTLSYEERLLSAQWLVDRGIKLPAPIEIKDGVLIGIETKPSLEIIEKTNGPH